MNKQRQISVKGIGSVSAKPDLVVILMNFDTSDKDYPKTMSRAAKELDALKNAIKGIGFDPADLKTTDFSINSEFESVKDQHGDYKRIFRGYGARHCLKLEFDFTMPKLSETLFAISNCPTKPEFSIKFSVKDKNAVSEELLISATNNARAKAEILAKAAGVKLVELISIDYSWGELHLYSDTQYADELCEAAPTSGSIDISPEDIDVKDTVTFTWSIA